MIFLISYNFVNYSEICNVKKNFRNRVTKFVQLNKYNYEKSFYTIK